MRRYRAARRQVVASSAAHDKRRMSMPGAVRCATAVLLVAGGVVRAAATDLAAAADPSVDTVGRWMEQRLATGEGRARQHLKTLLEQKGLDASDGRYFAGLPTDGEPGLPLDAVRDIDVDGDGVAEVVVALGLRNPDGEVERSAAVYVFGSGERPRLRGTHRWPIEEDSARGNGVALLPPGDVTGDGRADVLGLTATCGAHTCMANVFVLTWRDGRLERVPGDVGMLTPTRFSLDMGTLTLSGGTVNSVGAGLMREHTDRYRLQGGALRPISRTYAPARSGWDDVIDGVRAESLGRVEVARAAFTRAVDVRRAALAPGDAVDPMAFADVPESDGEAIFADALRSFARLRLARLLLAQGDRDGAVWTVATMPAAGAGLAEAVRTAVDAETACLDAAAWARATPQFLAALNSRHGYANPTWRPENLCSGLPDAF